MCWRTRDYGEVEAPNITHSQLLGRLALLSPTTACVDASMCQRTWDCGEHEAPHIAHR